MEDEAYIANDPQTNEFLSFSNNFRMSRNSPETSDFSFVSSTRINIHLSVTSTNFFPYPPRVLFILAKLLPPKTLQEEYILARIYENLNNLSERFARGRFHSPENVSPQWNDWRKSNAPSPWFLFPK